MRALVVVAVAGLALLPIEAGAQSPAPTWWILWSRIGGRGGQDATALDTFDSRAACEATAKSRQASHDAKTPAPSKDIYKDYLCFPVGVTPVASTRWQ